ncbi:adenosylmethionine--8-amino-7-oxononanoate transaminase [Aquimarina agarilytica]|uniref:adenosylmethionine--8-amino-7-oxononanoate transaminase n=1 Tax=Aquimarina agarilytica TaxID=1087449 RepID=UPI0002891134|nr:adenosylmethionine--8-amino-7-oxononanoate transaminase [Aquimarina agarilytica]
MSLQERDKAHIWHPLTQHKTHPDVLPIHKAKGALLYDENENTYIDGIASWYTCIYGHCHPYIIEKVYAQMQQLDQIVFSGFTHQPAVELSEKLIRILPQNQQKVFFSDNGSTTTEIGIKMALQYHYNKGNSRNTILAFEEGFHGDTFGAMSASDLSVYNGPFEEHFINVVRIPVPTMDTIDAVLEQLKQLITTHQIAGFIYEPLVQGAAGMKMYPAEAIHPILELCKSNEIICIADEVMTGFGKTGPHFASESIATKPDIMCLSKALTAGMMPMGVTTCTQKIYDAFYSNDMGKGLFHAHTYTANPLACASASAGIDLLVSDEIQQSKKRIAQAHIEFVNRLEKHSKVTNVRTLGVIVAFELDIKMERYGKLRDQLFEHFKNQGVYLRPLGSTIYILPPYVTTTDQLNKIYQSIDSLLNSL